MFNYDSPRWNDMNEAIIGITSNEIFVYSIPIMIQLCVRLYGMDVEEAMEWVDFNILNSYIGEKTPIHIWPKE